MKLIKIIIERSKDAFWGYAENVEGVSGVGNTVAEVKESVLKSIEIVKSFEKQTPAILKGEYARFKITVGPASNTRISLE